MLAKMLSDEVKRDYTRILENAGLKGPFLDSHPDLNGKWGGGKAWIVVTGDNLTEGYIYILVGPYWEVGCWPHQERPSRWEVVKRLLEVIDLGVPLSDLLGAINDAHNRQQESYAYDI